MSAVNKVTLILRDKTTLQETKRVTVENTLTVYGEYAAANLRLAELLGTLSVTEVVSAEDVPIMTYFKQVESVTSLESSVVYGWDDVDVGDRSFSERKARFDPPSLGTTRTVNTVLLNPRTNYGITSHHDNGTYRYVAIAYAPLTTTFVQSDSEVLDIVYRVEYKGNFDSPDFNIFGKWKAEQRAVQKLDESKRINFNPFKYSEKVELDSGNAFPDYEHIQGDADANPSYYDPFFDFSTSLADTQWIGKFIRSFQINLNDVAASRRDKGSLWGLALSDDFPNMPVQVLHNHRATADKPFQDVDHLAFGSGLPIVEGSAWAEQPFLDFYSINIGSTGATGVAGYSISKMKTTGFDENRYRVGEDWLDKLGKIVPAMGYGTEDFEYLNWESLPRIDLSAEGYIEFPWVIGWDPYGACLLNVETQEYYNYGAFYGNTLGATHIAQACAQDDGTLWVACKETGLHKIQNPRSGSPLVTSMTVALNGVPSDTTCYGVCEGYNDSIWAIFGHVVSHTTDGGASWTNYDSALSVSAGKWPYDSKFTADQIAYIQCDISHPDHHIAVAYTVADYGTDEHKGDMYAVWYSPTDASFTKTEIEIIHRENYSYSRPSQVAAVIRGEGADAKISHMPQIRCGRKSGVWMQRHATGNNAYFRKMFWGTPITEDMGGTYRRDAHTSARRVMPPCFFETESSVYVTNPQELRDGVFQSSTTYNSSIADLETAETTHLMNEQYILANWNRATQVTGEKYPCLHRDDHGVWLAHIDLSDDSYFNPNFPVPSREIVVTEYGYNPTSTQFEKDFRADLEDIGIYDHDAKRAHFNLEDHAFNGRSYVDLSTVIQDALFDIDAGVTFAFSTANVDFDVKLDSATLLSFNGCRVDIEAAAINTDYKNITELYAPAHILNSTVSGNQTPMVQDVNYERWVYKYKKEGSQPYSKVVYNQPEDSAYVELIYPIVDNQARSFELRAVAPGGNSSYGAIWYGSSKYYSLELAAPLSDDVSFQFRATTEQSYSEGAWPGTTQHNATTAIYAMLAWFTIEYDDAMGIEREEQYHGLSHTHGGYFSWAQRHNDQFYTTYPNVFEDDDFNGTNLIEIRYHQVDGSNYDVECRRVTGPSTYVVLATKTVAGVFNRPDPALNVPDTGVQFIVGLIKQLTSRINGYVRFADFDIRDNVDDVSLMDLYCSGDHISTELYRDGVLERTDEFILPPSDSRVHDKYWGVPENVLQMGSHKYSKGFQNRYLKGDVRNLQVWAEHFDGTDIAADLSASNASHTGIAATPNPSNLIAHYSFEQDLTNAETKPTHLAVETMDNGLTVEFPEGGIVPSWNKTDYYTVGVGMGLLKDNATTFDYSKSFCNKPANVGYAFLENPAGAAGVHVTAVPSPSTNAYWQPVFFCRLRRGTGGALYNETGCVAGMYHSMSVNRNYSENRYSANDYVRSFQTMPSNGEIKFRTAHDACAGSVGLVDSNDADGVARPSFDEGARFILYKEHTFDLEVNGVIVDTGRAYTRGDLFRISRSGNVFTFYHNTTEIHTFTYSSQTTALQPGVELQMLYAYTAADYNYPSTFYDMEILASNDGRSVLFAGDSVSQLGCFSPKFATFGTLENQTKILLDSVEVVPYRVDLFTADRGGQFYSIRDADTVVTQAGEVAFCPQTGVLIFHADDIGKPVEFNSILVERK